MKVKEAYTPYVVPVNGTVTLPGVELGFFLASSAGSFTLTNGNGTVLLSNHQVLPGQYTPLPLNVFPGATFVAAGGASGLLGA